MTTFDCESNSSQDQELVIASTSPNRGTRASGSINVPESTEPRKTKIKEGMSILTTTRFQVARRVASAAIHSPGRLQLSAELYQNANVSWSVFQDKDNFDNIPLTWFGQFQDASETSDLYKRGVGA